MVRGGYLQAHEEYDLDEIICLCGTWFPVEEAVTYEGAYGTVYSELCPKCWYYKNKWLYKRQYELRKKRGIPLVQALKDRNVLNPEVASRIVEYYRRRCGGVDGLVEKLCDIIDGDDKVAAVKALELYVAMTRVSSPDEQAKFILERDESRKKKPSKKHELYHCPF